VEEVVTDQKRTSGRASNVCSCVSVDDLPWWHLAGSSLCYVSLCCNCRWWLAQLVFQQRRRRLTVLDGVLPAASKIRACATRLNPLSSMQKIIRFKPGRSSLCVSGCSSAAAALLPCDVVCACCFQLVQGPGCVVALLCEC
jgi:hypothetical protein